MSVFQNRTREVKKVLRIINKLRKGESVAQCASNCKVSRACVMSVLNGSHHVYEMAYPPRTEVSQKYYRCPECGAKLTSWPCVACNMELLGRIRGDEDVKRVGKAQPEKHSSSRENEVSDRGIQEPLLSEEIHLSRDAYARYMEIFRLKCLFRQLREKYELLVGIKKRSRKLGGDKKKNRM